MPFRSKAQQRFMFAAEDRGELKKGTAESWARKTPSIKKLPEKVEKGGRKKEAHLSAAFELGRAEALREAGMTKEGAGGLGGVLADTKALWLPAAAGSYFAGPEERGTGALLGLGAGALGRRLGMQALERLTFSPKELKTMRKFWTTRGLEKKAPELYERLQTLKRQKPLLSMLTGVGAGGAAGYALQKSKQPGGILGSAGQINNFPDTPAVSDMATHYAGLVPGEEYYI